MGTPLSVAIEEMNPGYCEMKAQELIKEARICASEAAGCDKGTQSMEWYNEKITRAVSLLAYARVLRNGAVQG